MKGKLVEIEVKGLARGQMMLSPIEHNRNLTWIVFLKSDVISDLTLYRNDWLLQGNRCKGPGVEASRPTGLFQESRQRLEWWKQYSRVGPRPQ